MKNTHLIKIIKSLDKKEIKSFKDFIYSPFFNKNEKIQQLLEFIMRAMPHFKPEKLDKKLAFAQLFGKQAYSDKQLNNIISDLLQLLFQFLSYQNFQKMSEFEKVCLMDELLKKGLDDSMLKIGRKFRKAKDRGAIRNSSFFFDEYLYYKQMDEHFLNKPSRKYDDNLQLKSDNLDLFYVATKLKIACDMASRNIVIKANYQSHFLNEITTLINEMPLVYQKHPAITVYYRVLQMIEKQDAIHYFKLKSLLATNLSIFAADELRVLYDYARNYCIQQINKGNTSYYEEILELYQFLLEQKIIFKNGYLTQWDYKNIVTVGMRLKAFEWTEEFIYDYKSFLPDAERNNAFIYNLATFHYEQKDYKKSLLLLHEVKFTDVSYHIGAKIIQLKSYYELEETEAFYALIDAFRVYLIRNRKLSDAKKRANLNFLKLAQRIFQLQEQQTYLGKSAFNEKYVRLKNRLENTSPIVNAEWLKNALLKID